jgi:hypothetical protein
MSWWRGSLRVLSSSGHPIPEGRRRHLRASAAVAVGVEEVPAAAMAMAEDTGIVLMEERTAAMVAVAGELRVAADGMCHIPNSRHRICVLFEDLKEVAKQI